MSTASSAVINIAATHINTTCARIPSPAASAAAAAVVEDLLLPPTHVADPFDLKESLAVGVVSAVFWVYLHYIARSRYNNSSSNGSSNTSGEFSARIVSWVHAVVSTIGAAYALLEHRGIDFNAPATRIQADMQMVTLSYFLVDTAAMIVLGEFDLKFFAHHILSCASLVLGSLFGVCGVIVCAAQLAGEISNPFMHGRWLLHESGFSAQTHPLQRAVTAVWFSTFAVARCVVSPLLLVKIVETDCMHVAYWPQVVAMIVFSTVFLIDAAKKELRGEHWTG